MKKIKKLGVLLCAFMVMFLILPVIGCSHSSGSDDDESLEVSDSNSTEPTSTANTESNDEKEGEDNEDETSEGEDYNEEDSYKTSLETKYYEGTVDEVIKYIGYLVDYGESETYTIKIDDDTKTSYVSLVTALRRLDKMGIYIELDLSDSKLTLDPLEEVKGTIHHAFANCSVLTSVILPTGIESIGMCAFQSCDSLTYVKIPKSVTYIGYAAFRDCKNLTSADFETKTGWILTPYSGHNDVSLEENDLNNKQTVATYLTDTYTEYTWEREESEG